jgi:peptidoglycan/xylan/chitin deacetylase (PgdA/CDA1 family)
VTLVHRVCFHGIGTPGPSVASAERRYWVKERAFDAILDVLTGTPNVEITFDDGNASDVEIGLAALRDRGLGATFFVVAGRLGQPGYLDTGAVRELVKDGMTIGTHGMDHRPWRGLSTSDRHRELIEARAVLAEVAGSPVDQAAVPMGAYDRRLLAELRRLGYAAVHTSDRRLATDGAWLRPRFSVRADDTVETVRTTILSVPSSPRRAWLTAKGWAKTVR